MISVILVLFGVVSSGIGEAEFELGNIAMGAAGAALVLFAYTESVRQHRPLTLGHQLVMWWYWALILPFYFVFTRSRRPASVTALLLVSIGIVYLYLAVLLFRDFLRFGLF